MDEMSNDERDERDEEPKDEIMTRLRRVEDSVVEAITYWGTYTRQSIEDAAGALEEAIGEAQRVVRELDNMLDDGKP